MRPFAAEEIRGNWVTMLLPINSDDSNDFGMLELEFDRLIAARVSGIYSNDSAGEFYAQTESEFDRVSETLTRKSRSGRTSLPNWSRTYLPLRTDTRPRDAASCPIPRPTARTHQFPVPPVLRNWTRGRPPQRTPLRTLVIALQLRGLGVP
jgi:hypothetical protein